MATIFILIVVAFLAGFIDAIVGGGGLLQTPAGLMAFPNESVARVIGSLKIPSFTGALISSRQYLKKSPIPITRILLLGGIAFGAAFLGSWVLTQVSNQFFKPMIFFVLILIAIYTYTKKNLGLDQASTHTPFPYVKGVIIALILGFYDGFIGPGAGSILVLLFISQMGFDFMRANAHAKIINVSTNLGSITLFLLKGAIMWHVALPMAIANAMGGWLGAKFAIKRGNQFIRRFFLIIIIATLCRLGYTIFFT